MPRAQDAQSQRQEKRQQKADAAQLQRERKSCANDCQHVHFVFVGDAELAAQRALQPDQILLRNRLVQPQPCFCLRALGRLHLFGALAVIGNQRVSGACLLR